MIAYRSLFAMGTRLEMVLPEAGNETANQMFEVVREKLNEHEKMLSIYIEDSEFSRINQNAPIGPWKTSEECFNLISSLMKYSKLTRGYFDPGLGLMKKELFDNDNEEVQVIHKTDIRERIELNHDNRTIAFKAAGIKLDSGAFGKGYALDSLKKVLLSYNIKNAFISFGDSSVMTLGKHPAGDCWKIGIRDLVDERSNAWTFEINDGCVSTSGNTVNNRSKTEEGHIFNPDTGKFEDRRAVVSVRGTSALETEILSTALFVANNEERKEIMNNFPQYEAVELVYSEAENKTLISQIK